MRTTFIAIGLLFTCAFAFSQRIIDEKAEVRYVQLPMTVMPDVRTYNCAWNNEAVKQDIPKIDTELGYNLRTVAGYLALQGFSFTNDHPDVTITLESGRFELPAPAIVDISESDDATNFRAKYTIPLNWIIKVDGKIINIPLNEILYIKGMQRYIQIVTKNNKYTSLTSLFKLSEHLPKETFLRVHKSYIINVNNISSIEGNIIRINDEMIPISKGKRDQFFKDLEENVDILCF